MSADTSASRFTSIDHQHLREPQYVGSGGFGIVYKARHRIWGIPVAVKRMRVDRSGTDELLEEAKKMKEAQFEYIVRFYGVTEWPLENGITPLGLVTEFMENGSLDRLLRHYKVPWSLRLRFAYEIALGMNFLHNLKPALFHHDLKTANILLNKDYRIKICDFGLAKWRKFTGQCSSKCSKNGGTLSYIPPECLEDLNARKDVKFDVYSYAIVIWEILTCRTPYENAINPEHVKLCVKDGQRPDLATIPADRPDVLFCLMRKCWHEDPQKRPTFSKCVHDLEPEQSNEQELRLAIQNLTSFTIRESSCVDEDCDQGWPGCRESSSVLCEPVEEQNECNALVEPVQETNRKQYTAEAAQNTSPEENIKYPLSVVTSDECWELAKWLNKDWKALGRYLGLTQGDINAIDHDYERDGLIEKAGQMFQTWRQQQGKDANRAELVSHLKKIRGKDMIKMFYR
ncbi:receptor-interacting serine/threonine-protein kinase 2-like isoform X2 [Heptranchias perlo]|uniref:receptor-interacting serine/threonine-protein kinase 2-like isoform X2 n=1 Tax=Heptranchias perlo TaxID=212740 RepID=UPI0035597EE1